MGCAASSGLAGATGRCGRVVIERPPAIFDICLCADSGHCTLPCSERVGGVGCHPVADAVFPRPRTPTQLFFVARANTSGGDTQTLASEPQCSGAHGRAPPRIFSADLPAEPRRDTTHSCAEVALSCAAGVQRCAGSCLRASSCGASASLTHASHRSSRLPSASTFSCSCRRLLAGGVPASGVCAAMASDVNVGVVMTRASPAPLPALAAAVAHAVHLREAADF